MAVGYPQDLAAINSRAGSLAYQMRELLGNIQNFQSFLSGQSDAALVALGFVEADVTLLKGAYTQLDALRLVAYGQQAQPAANNFLFFSNKLTGVS